MSEGEKNEQANPVLTELKNILSQAQTIASELNTRHQTITEQLNALEGQRSAMQNVADAINSLKAEAENSKNSVLTDIQIISQKRTEFEDLKIHAQTSKDELTNKQTDLAVKISEINSAYDRVSQQQKVLFDDSTDQNGVIVRAVVNQIYDSNTAIKNLLADSKRDSEAASTEIDKSLEESETKISALNEKTESDLKQLVERSTTEISQLKNSLETEIRSLLPEAGTVGFASTFYNAKSRYALTPPDPSLKKLGKLTHFFKGALAPIFFYLMFIIPLCIIVYIFWDIVQNITHEALSGSTKEGAIVQRYEISPSLILFRFMLSLPLAAISLFGWSSISTYRKLYEEYNHKQRVMELYRSFKEEIDLHDDEELKKSLLKIMLKTVGDKASGSMGKSTKNELSIQDLFEQLKKLPPDIKAP